MLFLPLAMVKTSTPEARSAESMASLSGLFAAAIDAVGEDEQEPSSAIFGLHQLRLKTDKWHRRALACRHGL